VCARVYTCVDVASSQLINGSGFSLDGCVVRDASLPGFTTVTAALPPVTPVSAPVSTAMAGVTTASRAPLPTTVPVSYAASVTASSVGSVTGAPLPPTMSMAAYVATPAQQAVLQMSPAGLGGGTCRCQRVWVC
jgi:hypothetical protein